jgi:hypothetical protein
LSPSISGNAAPNVGTSLSSKFGDGTHTLSASFTQTATGAVVNGSITVTIANGLFSFAGCDEGP